MKVTTESPEETRTNENAKIFKNTGKVTAVAAVMTVFLKNPKKGTTQKHFKSAKGLSSKDFRFRKMHLENAKGQRKREKPKFEGNHIRMSNANLPSHVLASMSTPRLVGQKLAPR